MKRLLVLLLALTMLLTSTAFAESTFPLAEPVTFSMFTIVNNNVELGDVLAFQKLTEMTNVHWNITSALPVELAEKRSTMLATAENYPDVFYRSGLDNDTVYRQGVQGTFIALNDLLAEYAPNFLAELDSRPGARDTITMADGNIYALPQLVRPGSGWINFFINQAWLDKLNLEMPTTLEAFKDVLIAFRDGDPNGNGEQDEIPFICTTGFLYYFLPNFGIEVDTNSNGCNMAVIDGEYQHIYSSEAYKEFLTFMTDLYAEGLLDKNTFIQSGEQQQAIGASGDTIGCFFDLASYLTVGRERDAQFLRVPVFADHVLPYSPGIGPNALAITDKCANPELVLQWVDYLYTQEGGALVFMGIEGETYQMNEDGTWDWILGDYADISTLRAATCMQGGALDPSIQPDLWFENASDASEYKFNHDIPGERELSEKVFPVLKFSEEDQADLSTIQADINPYVEQYQAQVITGALSLEESWDEYVATMNRMGLDRMIEMATTAHNQAE